MTLNLIVTGALIWFGCREIGFVVDSEKAGHHPLFTYVGYGIVGLHALTLLAVWL